MNQSIKLSVLASTLLLASAIASPGKDPAQEERLKWWDEARFGMFIHWGVYAVPAGIYQGREIDRNGEWIMNRAHIPVAEYKKFAEQFNPDKYDPEAWVKLAKDAGMKYIVITSKHHDGFALYDSKVTDWDVVNATPYGKDLLAPLVEACRREGIKIGFYYSHSQDWVHPGGRAAAWKPWKGHWDEAQHGDYDEYIDKVALPQVREILTNYGDIDVLWWDTPMEMTPERVAKFDAIIAEHPKIITNNRLGEKDKGDTETPEQHIPETGFPDQRRFEVCMTMNDTWGYKSWDHTWKSTKELIGNLSDIASKGGNFLLNVGPTAEGLIPEPSVERLREMGEWLRVNGEAVYGTTANPFEALPWGRTTRNGPKLYLHVLQWPADGVLELPMSNKATKAYPLADPETMLATEQLPDRLRIVVGKDAPDDLLPVMVLEFEGGLSVTSGKK
jgi:alpha-L-fucosidase